MNIRGYVLAFLVLALGAGCSAPKSNLQEPLMFTAFDDFKRGPEGGVDLVWSTKRISDAQSLKTVLQKYDSLLVDQTWVAVDKATSLTLNDEQIRDMSKRMVKAIQTRLGQGFKLVETANEKTLRLKIALTNLETPTPILSVTNRLSTIDSEPSRVTTMVAAEQANIGSITVELLVSDGKTDEPLVAAIDKRFTTKPIGMTITAKDGAKESIALWAERLWITLRDWNWIKARTPAS